MFFYLTKIVGLIFEPTALVAILVAIAAALAWTRWWRAGRVLLAGLAVALAAVTIPPIPAALMGVLENRFPRNPALPARVDGIIVLGGAIDPGRSVAFGQPQIGPNAERLTSFVTLARRYPAARLVYSGGSGDSFDQDNKEADIAKLVFAGLGFDTDRVLFERASRNTYENATFSKLLAEPKAGETWLLITSAAHMPRAVGVFERVGWTVIPYPVDFRSSGRLGLDFRPRRALTLLGAVLYESAGLVAYDLNGYTTRLFPGPR